MLEPKCNLGAPSIQKALALQSLCSGQGNGSGSTWSCRQNRITSCTNTRIVHSFGTELQMEYNKCYPTKNNPSPPTTKLIYLREPKIKIQTVF